MKKWIFSSIALLIIASLAGAFQLGFFAPSLSTVSYNPIQRIELVDLNGDSHSFDELAGEETLLYFYASWCAPCYKTLSTLEYISQNYSLDIILQTVALDEDVEGIADMLEDTGFTGETWLASEGTAALQKRYFGNESRAVPYVLRLDAATNILEAGYDFDANEWEDILVNGSTLSSINGL